MKRASGSVEVDPELPAGLGVEPDGLEVEGVRRELGPDALQVGPDAVPPDDAAGMLRGEPVEGSWSGDHEQCLERQAPSQGRALQARCRRRGRTVSLIGRSSRAAMISALVWFERAITSTARPLSKSSRHASVTALRSTDTGAASSRTVW